MGAEPECAARLVRVVDRAAAALHSSSDQAVSARPAPGKWSVKEIVGHLIESAAHNHQRFVRARWQDDLIFPGYAQDDWVAAQDYQAAPWPELATLWQSYNHHIARVMAGVPLAVRTKVHVRHNLDQIAWQTVPVGEPTTLDYFMLDYVAHLEHHVRQIARVVPAGLESYG
jgi:hypothetical protein